MSMHHVVSMTVGAASAAAGYALQATGAVSMVSATWSLFPVMSGIAGAAISWGLMKGRIDAAHDKISAANEKIENEKRDRLRAHDDLKRDIAGRLDKVDDTLGKIFDVINNRQPTARTRKSDVT